MPKKTSKKTVEPIVVEPVPIPIVVQPVEPQNTEKSTETKPKKIRYINYLFKSDQPIETEGNFSKYFEFDGGTVRDIDYIPVLTDTDNYLFIKTAVWKPLKFDIQGLMKDFKLKHVKNSFKMSDGYDKDKGTFNFL